VLQKLGSWRRLIPATPTLVRYKREVSVKQEENERAVQGPPSRLPAPGNKKWLESVPRIEAECVCAA